MALGGEEAGVAGAVVVTGQLYSVRSGGAYPKGYGLSEFFRRGARRRPYFHHYDIMVGGGTNRLEAAAVLVPFGFIAAGSNLLTGVLMDRLPPRFLLSASLVLLCSSLALASYVTTPLLVLVYGAVLGAAQGTRGAISGSAYAHLFGHTYIGSIKGFVATLIVAGTAVGPLRTW